MFDILLAFSALTLHVASLDDSPVVCWWCCKPGVTD